MRFSPATTKTRFAVCDAIAVRFGSGMLSKTRVRLEGSGPVYKANLYVIIVDRDLKGPKVSIDLFDRCLHNIHTLYIDHAPRKLRRARHPLRLKIIGLH